MYKLHLILKYLLKRRIAWVSLAAVMLCTTMVLVVISVMGGWLNMFKTSFRGLSGDIVIHTESLQGFRYYDEIIDALKKDSTTQVEAAVPSIETYGLFDYGSGPVAVRVMGINIAEMGKVNSFPQSLYRQHAVLDDELHDPKTPPERQEKLKQELSVPPSFDLMDEVSADAPALPTGLNLAAKDPATPAGAIAAPADAPAGLRNALRYDAIRHKLVFKGRMRPEWRDALVALSPDAGYRADVKQLYELSQKAELINYKGLARGKPHALIVGVGVVGIRRNQQGVWDRPGQIEYTQPCRLTVLDLSGGKLDAGSQVTKSYFIVDDSHLGVWQYDSMYVYVPIDELQKDLGLDAQAVTRDDKPVILPGRVTGIHIKLKDGIDPNNERELLGAKARIEAVVHEVTVREDKSRGEFDFASREPVVDTWQQTQRIWISAVENEKLLTVFLFGIMCVVAIFLIFCIFYMIVVEKTRDIGIIKSVGATSSGVASIFLGYGLVIGVIGGLLGLLVSFLIVHNINPMHEWLGRAFGMKIWDPQVYLFDKIPNTMSMMDIAWILPTAVVASVLGALIPAVRAARMNPVEALRWE